MQKSIGASRRTRLDAEQPNIQRHKGKGDHSHPNSADDIRDSVAEQRGMRLCFLSRCRQLNVLCLGLHQGQHATTSIGTKGQNARMIVPQALFELVDRTIADA